MGLVVIIVAIYLIANCVRLYKLMNSATEAVYTAQGVAFVARPVTVIGTFNSGTSVSTHTNYTDGTIISGNIIFQNVILANPFSTIEFQILNVSVVGSIM